MKWLGRGIEPGRTTWYDFRDRMDKVIAQLNTQLVQQATTEQLIRPEHASQEGSTFRSHASRHQAFNRSRLEKHIVVSLTDPDPAFAKDKENTCCFLYTAQLMVDNDSLMIIGYSLAAENTDVCTIGPMIY